MSKIQLQKHQERVINHLSTNRGALAIHGTGKTLLSVGASIYLLFKKIVAHVVFISPVSLQDNFKKTIIKVNNEKLLPYHISPDDLDTKVKYYTIQGFINKNDGCKNSLIIVDEAQNIRTLNGKYFNQILACAKYAKRVLLLSATPIVNYPHDIVNLIALLRGVDPIKLNEFYQTIDSTSKAKKYFENVFHFYNRPEDDINFPKYEIRPQYITMNKEYEKLYKNIEVGNANKIPDFKGKNIKVFYNGIRRASNAINTTNSKYSGQKIQFILDKIKELPNKKHVIFSHYVNMGIKIITDVLNDMRIKYEKVDGSINKRDRQIIVDKYNKKDITVLLISKAGGEGLDLKDTDFIYVLEPTWNYALLQQIMGRGVRYKSHVDSKGQPIKNATVVIYLLYLIKSWEKKHLKEILNNQLLNPDDISDISNISDISDDLFSIDLYLKNYTDIKQENLVSFMHLIQKYKIK